MKVIACAADSASVKVVHFNKFVDSRNPQSEKWDGETMFKCEVNGPKKMHAITHIVQFSDSRLGIARRTGEILIDGKQRTHLNAEVIGFFLTANEDLVVFSADGQCVIIADNTTVKLETRKGLSVVAQNPQDLNTFASAGKEQLPEAYNLLSDVNGWKLSPVWAATQPPNDRLDLPELNLVTAMTFVDLDSLVAVTSHGRMRSYDLQTKSGQPEQMIQVTKDAIKCVVSDAKHPKTVIISDSRGTVGRWSIMPFKLLGNYAGVHGSTRSISIRGPYMATGGLDRYLRVFDVVNRTPKGLVYLGEELWSVLLVAHDDEEGIGDMDSLWDEIGLQHKKRKIEGSKISRKEPAKKNHERRDLKFSKAAEEDSGDDDEESSESSFKGFD